MRQRGALLLSLMLFGLYVIRLFQLQVLEHKRWAMEAEENYTRTLPIPHLRGLILDRKGRVLAGWEPSFQVMAVRERLSKGEIHRLEEVLGRPLLPRPDAIKGAYTVLQTGLPFETVLRLEERSEHFPWVAITAFPRRAYPYRDLFFHALGYVGEISAAELAQRRAEGYRQGDRIGKMGIERAYEPLLRGRDGVRFLRIDALGRVVEQDFRPPIKPQKGKDLVLSLDLDLQEAAARLLAPYERAALVALDPRTGEVLALYSKPGIDPNLLVGGVPAERWRALTRHEASPLLNRVIAGLYPPGSIFKLVTGAVALELGLLRPETHLLPCTGSYRLGRRVFKCWKPEGHGSLDLPHAIEASCDVYFYQVGRRVGLAQFTEFLARSGIFEPTGIDLPGEKPGFVPTIPWYTRTYGKYGYGEGNVLNLAIGQGEILMTPIQITLLTAAIAMGGKAPRPHLNRDMVPDTFRLPFSPQTLSVIREGMWLAVNGEHGTARYTGHSDRVSIAGKTGTAQNPHGEDHSLFTAFAPYKDPRIVVTVVVEHGGHGSEAAAPVARALIEEYLQDEYALER